MSIATEIQRLQGIKSEIMAALERKNVGTTGKNMSDVGDLIRSIQSEDDSIPLYGYLAHQFNFTLDNPTPYVDTIGGVTCLPRYNTPTTSIYEDGIEVSGTYGINTNVTFQANDYVELLLNLRNFDGSTGSSHVRPLNVSKNTSGQIDDSRALVIWRGDSYKYWSTYTSGWRSSFSNDYNLFNGKKLGLYFKPTGLMDIYVDNTLMTKDFYANWSTGWSSEGYKYCLGVTTTNWTSSEKIHCKRLRVFRNCHY